MLQKLPVDSQTFADIRGRGELYVDKTAHIVRMLDTGRYFFLSRPRRFGKSILVTTLKSFFEGKKDLFVGLELETYPEWETFPVLHIDFSLLDTGNPERLRATLKERLAEQAKQNGVQISFSAVENAGNALLKSILALWEKTGKRVVLLIDEYDQPITDRLEMPDIADQNREVLRDFFSIVKGLDAHIRFVFITGVSKFAKVSVFSGLNNPLDISLMAEFNAITGFTEAELAQYFSLHLERLAEQSGYTPAELRLEMKALYDGFSWTGVEKVYNPYSVIRCFRTGELGNYWFASATPAFLIKNIRQQQIPVAELENIRLDADSLDAAEIRQIAIPALLFQTGYLTVVEKRRENGAVFYKLNYPNREVRRAFYTHLLAAFADTQPGKTQPDAHEMRILFAQGKPEDACNILRRYISHIPGKLHVPAEKYYQSLVYMALSLSGMKTDLEKWVATGILDGVIELQDRVWIIEFKYAAKGRPLTLAKNAVAQISKKQYDSAWKDAGKKVYALGIGVALREPGFAWAEIG
jgi:Predicted AAA-ATPase/PD-(D/E)XK nuclease superfamily